MLARNNLSIDYPNNQYYMKYEDIIFDFGLVIPHYVQIIIGINLLSIPSYFVLKEEKVVREKMLDILK